MRSVISLAGMVLTTLSAILFLVVFFADLFGWHTNPYLGIVFFLVLPAIFLSGLALIPLGAWIERRRRAAGKASYEMRWPTFDFNDPAQRLRAGIVFGLTVANIVIVSLASYRGIEYMDSVEFCGQVCHSVMKPEFVAYQEGPHSRVTCVQCHIGSGASWFAKSKISGARQVLAVSFNTYSRPIPSPVQDLRPARDTCEQCHWPDQFHGDVVRRVVEYAEDEENTESVTTLTLHVGGTNRYLGLASGIHWHTNAANQVEYVTTDDQRQVIPYVRLTDSSGTTREYFAEGVTAEDLVGLERRVMDCMDCHNRPSHPMASTAERAVNEAMARGAIPVALPFVRREAVKALKTTYTSEQAAVEGIARTLRAYYSSEHEPLYTTRRQEVEQAVDGIVDLFKRNVFPEMNVQFGTYPNNLGHFDFPGCFRCHDDGHTTSDGQTIGQDCETCHTME